MLSRHFYSNQSVRCQAGFSLLELVTVFILISVLMASVLPRLDIDASHFEHQGAYDDVRSVLQYARQLALSSRRYVCIEVDSKQNRLEIERDEKVPEEISTINCKQEINLPANDCDQAHYVCMPAGISLSVSGSSDEKWDLYFSPEGRLVNKHRSPASNDIEISIGEQKSIHISAATGAVQ